MKIVLDAFGGDRAPLAVLQGVDLARKEFADIEFILTGDENIIQKTASEQGIALDKVSIVHAPLVMPVEAHPNAIRKEYKESSLAKALQIVANGEADAYVGAGSTGAIVFGATFIVKRLKGVKRLALAPVMPGDKGPFLLLDVGANADCRPEMLVQFGMMGAAYMKNVMGVENPKVGIVNIGEEETKGSVLYQETHQLMKEAPLNFVGNVEARDILSNKADVVVADGFTGNICLKLIEGVAKTFSTAIKGWFSGVIGTVSGALVLKKVKAFKKRMDYKEHGGAVLLGCTKPVIKAHGSSDGKAFKNAIRQAYLFTKNDVIGQIADAFGQMDQKSLEE